MSFISENILPGKTGKTFCIGISSQQEFEKVLKRLKEINGIETVLFNNTVYPREITILTKTPVSVKEVQDAVREIGFRAVTNTIFG